MVSEFVSLTSFDAGGSEFGLSPPGVFVGLKLDIGDFVDPKKGECESVEMK